MATIRKTKKRRRLTFEGRAFFACVFMTILWMISSLFLGTINTSLTMDIQKKTGEIAALKDQNQTLSIEIQSLQNKDRVYVLAESAGLQQNQSNVVAITNGD